MKSTFKRILITFISRFKNAMLLCGYLFKTSLRLLEKRSINWFIHQLNERHALIGTQFSTDHIWGEKIEKRRSG